MVSRYNSIKAIGDRAVLKLPGSISILVMVFTE